jgi:hypothetical protein
MGPNVYDRVEKSPPLDPILIRLNPVHILTSCFLRSILILSFNLHLGLRIGPFCTGCPNKILHCISNLPQACYMSAHLILFDLIILIIFCREYRLWRSSVCSLLQSPVTVFPKSRYSPQHSCFHTSSISVIRAGRERKFDTPTKQHVKR